MAATLIPVSKPSRDGSVLVQITVADTVNGNAFVNNGQTFLILDNKDGVATATVTVVVTGKVDVNLAVPDRQYSINAGEIKMVGPYEMGLYNQPDGTVQVISTVPIGLIVATF